MLSQLDIVLAFLFFSRRIEKYAMREQRGGWREDDRNHQDGDYGNPGRNKNWHKANENESDGAEQSEVVHHSQ